MKFRVLNPDGSKPNLMAIALNEGWASQLDPCGMDGFALEEDGTLNLMDRSGRYACPPVGRFRVEMAHAGSAHVAFLDDAPGDTLKYPPSGHHFTTHHTYTGSGCAMCGQPEAAHAP